MSADQPGTIAVTLHGSRVMIDRVVFVELFENSVVSARVPYRHALERSTISFSDLVDLARTAQVPYALCFAPRELVRAQVETKTQKLLQGLSKDTFAVNSRTTIELSDVELIVKDLVRKQMMLRTHDESLAENKIVGVLRKPRATIEEDVAVLLTALDLDVAVLRSARSKGAALSLLIETLESHQILVSRSVRGFMPQLIEVKFSGLTIKDKKVPYIFLSRGSHGDDEEPEGRQLFTLTLLTVLVARGIFAPVTYDGRNLASNPGREYDIVGEVLMPAAQMRTVPSDDLGKIRSTADSFKVTPSALVVRLQRLGLISCVGAQQHLEELRLEFANRPKSQGRQPKPVNGVRTYNGRELSVRMLGALDAGKITEGEFCRAVCANKIRPREIRDFREALG
ncbi:hypothetical protein ACIPEP_16530 [Curtobacterium sp. NPDC087082]|uniref:Uncharacterized protein n=1 Tax=Curtobacterium subtropicum TaxID=3055138 RepID=A0ABT7TFH7_9MICO|nr:MULTISPECIES: hypothetical protein [Curtobacterium]MDM7888316.1 hypothetical protein [Curtobacterium subtropicum]PZO57007.1 MAG: hypothetical protein DI639_14680 [Leifsonia xyli]